ncbi:hypothetical protein BN871_CN_00180 [Paenibacillus sp. P22]|nr:hypothetical protein BN871_CN_00180 [Paenibacillus sp. P22]
MRYPSRAPEAEHPAGVTNVVLTSRALFFFVAVGKDGHRVSDAF